MDLGYTYKNSPEIATAGKNEVMYPSICIRKKVDGQAGDKVKFIATGTIKETSEEEGGNYEVTLELEDGSVEVIKTKQKGTKVLTRNRLLG